MSSAGEDKSEGALVLRAKIALWGIVAVVGFSAVACGDGDKDDKADDKKEEDGGDTGNGGGGGGSEDYVAAIMETSEDSTITEEQNRCFAEAVVDGIGADGFEAAGVTPDDIRESPDQSPTDLGITFDDEMKERFWGAVNGCVDVREMFVESMAQGQEITDEQRTCLSDGLDEEFVKAMMLAAFTGDASAYQDPEIAGKLTEVMTTCGTGTGAGG
jgi:hypothetical protein